MVGRRFGRWLVLDRTGDRIFPSGGGRDVAMSLRLRRRERCWSARLVEWQ